MTNPLLQPMAEIPRSEAIKLYYLGFTAILLVWAGLTASGLVSGLFLSTPIQTAQELVLLFTEKGIVGDIAATISRLFIGFFAAMAIGVPMGIFLGTFKRIESFLEPLINLFRYIPSAAIVPLAILWLGVGEPQKVFVVFFGTFPFIVLYTSYAIASIERKLLHAAYSLGAETPDLLTKVIFPKALPEIFEIGRIELGGAWGLVILSELVAATSGLGHRLILAQRFLQTPTLFAEIIIILAIGLLIDHLLKTGYKKLFPWAEKNRELLK